MNELLLELIGNHGLDCAIKFLTLKGRYKIFDATYNVMHTKKKTLVLYYLTNSNKVYLNMCFTCETCSLNIINFLILEINKCIIIIYHKKCIIIILCIFKLLFIFVRVHANRRFNIILALKTKIVLYTTYMIKNKVTTVYIYRVANFGKNWFLALLKKRNSIYCLLKWATKFTTNS
ncbi:hypothetical protein ACJX0J_018873, partial [Zea mays]